MTEPLTESEQVYPSPKRPTNWHLDRRWITRFDNLVYDDGIGSWERGYRTRMGARIAAFWHYHVASWGGGSVTITDTRFPPGQEKR